MQLKGKNHCDLCMFWVSSSSVARLVSKILRNPKKKNLKMEHLQKEIKEIIAAPLISRSTFASNPSHMMSLLQMGRVSLVEVVVP